MFRVLNDRVRNSGAAAIAAAFIAAPSIALASPFETTDADVAEGPEIKALWDAHGGRHQSERAPALDLTWAVDPGVLEVSLTTGAAQIRLGGGESLRGMSDTELAAKWKLIDGGETGLSLAVEPVVVAPSGSAGVADRQWRFGLPVIIQLRRGEMTYFANLAYSATFDGRDGEASFGVVAERQVDDRLAIGLELAGAAPASNWRDGQLDANLGVKFKLAPELELQGLIGRTVNGRDEGPATMTRLALEYAF